ncbi:MAG TPA: OmpA family protein [Gammaproteobacteria bacterium]|nr:OmpA family protein [Gammaproteobacteria bacterium]
MAALQKQGKSTDGDGDGVPDAADFCPESTGKELVGPTGCTLHIPVVMKGVHFRYDSHELTDDSRQVLDRIARLLRQHPDVRFEIAGHSDAQGDPAYNEWLSQQRAEEVKRYLVAHGVSAEQLTARGYGSRQPLAPNDSREGLLRNRRVELRRLP